MATREGARRAREALDRRLGQMGPPPRYAPPRLGWIRATRDALGMAAADLAARMGVSGASVRSLEEKEITGGIRLSSLRRAAEAMDCTLVYAFIPKEGLEATVRRQAQRVLDEQSRRVDQTMLLEAQEGEMPASSAEARLQQIIDSGRLWSEGDAKT